MEFLLLYNQKSRSARLRRARKFTALEVPLWRNTQHEGQKHLQSFGVAPRVSSSYNFERPHDMGHGHMHAQRGDVSTPTAPNANNTVSGVPPREVPFRTIDLGEVALRPHPT